MKEIWRKFCDWLIEKLGGVSMKTFNTWLKEKNNYIVDIKNENKFIRRDYNDVYAEKICLQQERDMLYERNIDLENYIKKSHQPKHEFVKIGYLSTYPESYTKKDIEYIVTTNLLEKIRNSNVIKYDYRDGEIVASVEVIK